MEGSPRATAAIQSVGREATPGETGLCEVLVDGRRRRHALITMQFHHA